MIAVLALIAFAVGTAFAAPQVLTRGRWQMQHPRLALFAWHAALGSGLIAIVASVILSVTIAVNAHGASSDGEAIVGTVLGWGSLAIVGAAIAVIAASSETILDASRDNHGSILALARGSVELEPGVKVTRCETRELIACAIPGPDKVILISTRLEQELTAAQLLAVVEHERTHLRQRHHLVMRLAEINAACLPRLVAAQRLRRSTALLVELIADDEAARRRGAANLANALLRLGTASGDRGMLVRAERIASRRWMPPRSLRTTRALVTH